MLRVAIPIFRSRVSPIFDSCVRALILDIEEGKVVQEKDIYLNKLSLSQRFKLLRQAGATIVVCGHISDPFYDMLSEANIKVINGIAGTVDEVVEAFISDRLNDRVFHLPGFPLKPSTGKGNERR